MFKNLILRLSCLLIVCYLVVAQFGLPIGKPKANPMTKGVANAKKVSDNLLSEDNLSACIVTVYCLANKTKSILDGRTKCTSMLDRKLNVTFRQWMNLRKLDLSKYSEPFEIENELFCKLSPEGRREVGKATQIKFFEFMGGDCLRHEPLNRCLLFDKFTECMMELMEGMLVRRQCNMEGVSKAIVTLEDSMKIPTVPSKG